MMGTSIGTEEEPLELSEESQGISVTHRLEWDLHRWSMYNPAHPSLGLSSGEVSIDSLSPSPEAESKSYPARVGPAYWPLS